MTKVARLIKVWRLAKVGLYDVLQDRALADDKIESLSEAVCKQMRGCTWHEDIPSPGLEQLCQLTIVHWDYDFKACEGLLVTHKNYAEEVLRIFRRLREIRFPIARMRPIREYGGDDGLSMQANNSSCFNSRMIINTTRLSAHALGAAIDINPVENPVIRDGRIRPAAGQAFVNREQEAIGLIRNDSPVIQIFAEEGWKWGGHWENPRDYHHFYRAEF